ncbi:t-SNARE [Dichotomocladium elegans]|nr:t-SNARE [Dichotomocladium elegans]
MEDDPFLLVKRQVEDALENATSLFDSWKRIQQTVSSPKNQELLWAADELTSALEAIEQDLDDLDVAFDASQANPSKFRLTAADLNSRRTFLTESRNTLQTIRNTMANPPAKKRWQILMQEQDTHLESISGTLVNLKEIAGTMNTELDDQAIILDDLGDRVDKSQGRLKRAMYRVTDVLKREEGKTAGLEKKNYFCY